MAHFTSTMLFPPVHGGCYIISSVGNGYSCGIHVTVDGCLIYPDATTKNLGIVYDSTLSMAHQVNAVCRGAYLRLHNISRIRRFLTQDATKTLIQAFVISKLDCGNALLLITFTPRR